MRTTIFRIHISTKNYGEILDYESWKYFDTIWGLLEDTINILNTGEKRKEDEFVKFFEVEYTLIDKVYDLCKSVNIPEELYVDIYYINEKLDYTEVDQWSGELDFLE